MMTKMESEMKDIKKQMTDRDKDKIPEVTLCEDMTSTKEDKSCTSSGSVLVKTKKIFPVGGGVKNIERSLDDMKCVFGGGRCGTHDVKLSRTIRDKRYSCVNLRGGWTVLEDWRCGMPC